MKLCNGMEISCGNNSYFVDSSDGILILNIFSKMVGVGGDDFSWRIYCRWDSAFSTEY